MRPVSTKFVMWEVCWCEICHGRSPLVRNLSRAKPVSTKFCHGRSPLVQNLSRAKSVSAKVVNDEVYE